MITNPAHVKTQKDNDAIKLNARRHKLPSSSIPLSIQIDYIK